MSNPYLPEYLNDPPTAQTENTSVGALTGASIDYFTNVGNSVTLTKTPTNVISITVNFGNYYLGSYTLVGQVLTFNANLPNPNTVVVTYVGS